MGELKNGAYKTETFTYRGMLEVGECVAVIETAEQDTRIEPFTLDLFETLYSEKTYQLRGVGVVLHMKMSAHDEIVQFYRPLTFNAYESWGNTRSSFKDNIERDVVLYWREY